MTTPLSLPPLAIGTRIPAISLCDPTHAKDERNWTRALKQDPFMQIDTSIGIYGDVRQNLTDLLVGKPRKVLAKITAHLHPLPHADQVAHAILLLNSSEPYLFLKNGTKCKFLAQKLSGYYYDETADQPHRVRVRVLRLATRGEGRAQPVRGRTIVMKGGRMCCAPPLPIVPELVISEINAVDAVDAVDADADAVDTEAAEEDTECAVINGANGDPLYYYPFATTTDDAEETEETECAEGAADDAEGADPDPLYYPSEAYEAKDDEDRQAAFEVQIESLKEENAKLSQLLEQTAHTLQTKLDYIKRIEQAHGNLCFRFDALNEKVQRCTTDFAFADST